MSDSQKQKNTYIRLWKRAKRRLRKPVDTSNTVNNDDIQTKMQTEAHTSQAKMQIDEGSSQNSDCEEVCPGVEVFSNDDNLNDEDAFWAEIDCKNEKFYVVPSESDTDDEEDTSKLTKVECKELALWAVQHRITHTAIEGLTALLRGHGHHHLPVKATTLLKTPKSSADNIKQKSGMDYYCYDLEQELQRILHQYPANQLQNMDSIDIGINIDGLPLFRSSLTNVWPVLCAVYLDPVTVFPVVLTSGKSKPKDLDFLVEFVDDLDTVLRNRLVVHDKIITINLRAVICDSPARAMVKNVKLCTGYFGCNHCNQKGLWINKVTYPEIDFTMRTDTSFRNHEQEAHHHGNTPLSILPMDMVLDFPMDYMHVACIGVMKRLLLVWKQGPRTTRLSATNVLTISEKLLQLKSHLPSLFARKPRSLSDVDRWKATELRQFMLYTGKYVLHKILRRDIYDNFLRFSVAMCLLVSPKSNNDINAARELMIEFVTGAAELYGQAFMVFNVHALLHLADDAKRFGSLEKCSAFVFENYLQEVKKDVRSGKSPIVQIMNRHAERKMNITKVAAKKSNLSAKRPNNAYILNSGSCGEILNIQTSSTCPGETAVVRVYERKTPLLSKPCDLTCISAFRVVQNKFHVEFIPTSELLQQAVLIPEGNEAIFLGVHH